MKKMKMFRCTFLLCIVTIICSTIFTNTSVKKVSEPKPETTIPVTVYANDDAESSFIEAPQTEDTTSLEASGNTTPQQTEEGATFAEVSKTSTIQVEEKASVLSERESNILAKLLYGEANDECVNDCERSMVIWCVLNRIDSGISWFGNTIEEIVTKPGQFTGYHEDAPITEQDLTLVNDVASRWAREKAGDQNVGRTLPKEYLFFVTDTKSSGWHNAFYCWSTGGLGGSNACQAYQVWYDYKNPISNPY